jgi:ARG/rhodanese/phosphatase superfamily protein
MRTDNASPQPIAAYLSEPLELGDPDLAGPLAVFPLFGPEPVLDYISFAEGREQGVVIKEVESSAAVNDLVVWNPTDVPILLFEGEEVLGAQQNRTFDVTVLVPASERLRVPVSCVEAGRWDHSRHEDAFAPAPQAAYPELRRAKSRQVRERVAAGGEARADQQAVWHHLRLKSALHEAQAPTGAMNDIYEAKRGRLLEFSGGIHRREGQVGALVAIGGKFAVLDYVSRPKVFSALHGALVQGYALDALEGEEAPPPSADEARGFISLLTGAEPSERDGIGLGREIRFAQDGLAGSGLVAGSELIQLTVFPEAGDGSPGLSARSRRIRRPSRRR